MSIPAINVRHNLERVVADLGLLPQERNAAAVRALNRTMTTVRAEAARSLAREFAGLKIGTIKKRLPFRRATRAAPTAWVTFKSTRFSLFHNWRVRDTGRTGVRVGALPYRLETWEGLPVTPAHLRQAFVQRPTANRGRHSVYIRVGKSRYPIEGIVAPSLAAAFGERHIGSAMVRLARSRFAVVLAQESRFRISRRK